MLYKIIKHIRQGTILKVIYNKLWSKEKRIKITGFQRNIHNKAKFGKKAPIFKEKVWIYPRIHNRLLKLEIIREHLGFSGEFTSAQIIEICWPVDQAFIITDFPKEKLKKKDWSNDWSYRVKMRFKFCYEHWVNEISWQETGVYDFMQAEIEGKNKQVDGCKNINDIIKRYEELDQVFNQVKKEGGFRAENEVDEKFAKTGRSYNQTVAHIGQNGDIYLTGGGWHRFTIAYILGLPMPAMIGTVHKDALPYIDIYRNKKSLIYSLKKRNLIE